MACDNFTKAENALINSLTGPLSVSGDAGSVTQRSARDMIDAANYLAGLCAMKTKRLGIRYTRLNPGGTVRGIPWNTPRWKDGPEW